MIICETIGLFVAVMLCIGVAALILSVFISGSDNLVDNEDVLIVSFASVIVILVLIASIFFVQFRHYPEEFGYTAIEEVEETE